MLPGLTSESSAVLSIAEHIQKGSQIPILPRMESLLLPVAALFDMVVHGVATFVQTPVVAARLLLKNIPIQAVSDLSDKLNFLADASRLKNHALLSVKAAASPLTTPFVFLFPKDAISLVGRVGLVRNQPQATLFGKVKHFILCEENTVAKTVAKRIALAAVAVLAVSAVGYLVGKALVYAGSLSQECLKNYAGFLASPLKLSADSVITVGESVMKASRLLALVVSVPVYAVGYQFPRWLMTEGIYLLADVVKGCLSTLVEGLEMVRQGLIYCSAALWNTLEPVLQAVASAIKGVWNGIYTLAIEPIIHAVHSLALGTIRLAAKGVEFVVTALTPVMQLIAETASFVWNNVFVAAFDLSLKAIQWVGTQLLQPALNAAISVIKYAGEQIAAAATATLQFMVTMLTPVMRLIAETASFVWNNVFVAAFDLSLKAIQWVGTQLLQPALNVAISVIKYAGEQIAAAATATLQFMVTMLTPFAQLTANVASFIWHRVIVAGFMGGVGALQFVASTILKPVLLAAANVAAGIAWAVFNASAAVATALNDYVIQPITTTSVSAMSALAGAVSQMTTDVIHFCRDVAKVFA